MGTRPDFWTDQIGIIGFQSQLIKCPPNFVFKKYQKFQHSLLFEKVRIFLNFSANFKVTYFSVP